MRRRRRRSPLPVEVPDLREGRPGALNRTALEAFAGLLGTIGDSQAVLATGGEAKSRLALGLATAAAVEGRRAALVECDLARPALAARLGLAEVPGLNEYLRAAAEAPQVLQPLVLAGPGSGRAVAPLICVTAGAPSPDGPALLASPAFAHAIAKLRDAYDLLVLDGPPLHDEPALNAVAALVDETVVAA